MANELVRIGGPAYKCITSRPPFSKWRTDLRSICMQVAARPPFTKSSMAVVVRSDSSIADKFTERSSSCVRAFSGLIRPRPPTRRVEQASLDAVTIDRSARPRISAFLIVSSSGENNFPRAVVLARNVQFPMKPCVNAA